MWLKVQFDQSELKLTWGNDAGPYPLTYAVAEATLREAADAVRQRLQALTDWSRGADPAALPRVLHRLATAGADLKFVLFDPIAGPGDSRLADELVELQRWRQEEFEGGDDRLWITADPNLHVPWGLVYEGDPAAVAEDAASIDAFANFWSLRYGLSTVFSGCSQPASSVNRSRESFRLLSALNRDEYTQASAGFGSELPDLEAIVALPVGRAFNVETVERLVADAAARDTIFYFFGHGVQGELDLGGSERVNVLKFKRLLSRLTERQPGRGVAARSVVFLNACDSALGDSDYSLRSATARPGLCGLVATEAEVPRHYALRFGYRFLKSMIRDGRSIGETMADLRRAPELWPLSLLYGCYAALDYRIAS